MAETAALPTSAVSSLSATQIAALSAAQIGALTTAALDGMTPMQIADLTATQAAALSATQVNTLSVASLTAFNSAAFAEIVGNLSAATLASMSTQSPSPQRQLLRNADPGVQLPGIDTATGNPLAASSLNSLSSLSTSSKQPIYYNASLNTVYVQGNGAVLSGYNLGSAYVVVVGQNDTIEDCTFNGSAGPFAIGAYNAATNLTVTDCTFVGNPAATINAVIYSPTSSMTITDNDFINTAGDGIWADGGGLVSGNYFCGAGNDGTSGHPDAIWVSGSSAPLTISDNFIDWSVNPAASGVDAFANDCIRITAECGSVSNVTATGNFLVGGETSIDAGNEGTAGTFSNISVTDNYMGFALAHAFYPGPMTGVTASNNVIFDYTNPIYSEDAWASYKAAGLPTANLVVSTDGSTISNSNSGSTTLYGSSGAELFGSEASSETNFVGGYGRQLTFGGRGANIFTYLSPADSTSADPDFVYSFDRAKDVIDLSNIDADMTAAGVQSFTFIGTNAFTSAGAEVRYQLNTANDTTLVQATLAGDTAPDLQIQIFGLVPLTASNFALTPSQSQADLAEGAALSDTHVYSNSAVECNYSNVEGKAYSSYSSFSSGLYYNNIVADDLNLSAASNEIDLYQNDIRVTRTGETETLAIGNGAFGLAYHANETIQASNGGAETFAFSAGYGQDTIDGFAASGTTADTLVLSISDFSYLTGAMSQAQDLAAVLSHVSSGSNGVTIGDKWADAVNLFGVSALTLTANPSAVKFI